MKDNDDNCPEFFKVYISHYSFKQMLIPSEFVKYMGDRKSGSSQLVGSSGQTWRVELVDDGNDLYFTDGWPDFVEDNMIRDGEFIFFKLHGNLIFSVIIYDKSMCEKVAVRKGIAEAGREELNWVRPVKREDVGPSQPQGPLFFSEEKIAERPAFSVKLKPFFEKCITVSNVKLFKFNLPISFVHEHSLSYKNNEKMVLRTSGNSSWEVKIINSHRKIVLTKGWRAFARDNNIRVRDICKFELLNRLEMMVNVVKRHEGIGQTNVNVSASENRSLKRTVGVSQHGKYGLPFVEEGQNAAARTMPSSVKPSFVLDIKKHNVDKCLLKIPPRFVQENALCYRANEKMILRMTEDSSWTVNIIRSENKSKCYYYFSSGWATFVHDNNIKEGDKCEFEILNRLEMKVHLTLSSMR